MLCDAVFYRKRIILSDRVVGLARSQLELPGETLSMPGRSVTGNRLKVRKEAGNIPGGWDVRQKIQ